MSIPPRRILNMICQHVSLLYISAGNKNNQVSIFTQVPPAMKSSKCQKSSWSGPNDVGIYSRDCQIFAYYSPKIPILLMRGGMGMWVPIVWEIRGISRDDVDQGWPRVFFLPNSSATHLCVGFYKRRRISKHQSRRVRFCWTWQIFLEMFPRKPSPLTSKKITRIDELQGTFGNSGRANHMRPSWKMLQLEILNMNIEMRGLHVRSLNIFHQKLCS